MNDDLYFYLNTLSIIFILIQTPFQVFESTTVRAIRKYRVRTLNPTLTRWALTPLNIVFSVAKKYTSVAYCVIFAINTAADKYPKKYELGE